METVGPIYHGLRLEDYSRRGSQEVVYLVKDGEQVVGLVTKFRQEKGYAHPWKAFRYAGEGRMNEMLGAYYTGGIARAVRAIKEVMK